MRRPLFYGWWIVAACLAFTAVGNALGLYGAGVYVYAISDVKGWPVSLISGAVTLFYILSALLLTLVGSAIGRFGPRPIVVTAALALAFGVAGIGRADAVWQVYVAFLGVGVAWACLSLTAVSATLAPWFDKRYGRAVSTASLGASVGGIVGAPMLLFGVGRFGLAATTAAAGAGALAILLPLALFVLKHRPQDIGLSPDGETPLEKPLAASDGIRWGRTEALRTAALGSVVAAFGLGLMAQIGFLTHQVALVTPSLGASGASLMVSATAAAALLGRLALAGLSDRIDARATTAAVLLLAAIALGAMALFPTPLTLIGAGLLYGVTVGNVTTLSPIIVRREFGAASFGVVFGVGSTGIQLAAALGPGLYGALHDASGGYAVPLLTAATLDIVAAASVVLGGRTPSRPQA